MYANALSSIIPDSADVHQQMATDKQTMIRPYNNILLSALSYIGIIHWIFLLSKLGMDGCGKETCATLACYLADHELHLVPESYNYAYTEFKEMFKNVLIQAGLEGSPSVLMLTSLYREQVSASSCIIC